MSDNPTLTDRLLLRHATRFTFPGKTGIVEMAHGDHMSEGWTFHLLIDGDPKHTVYLAWNPNPGRKAVYRWCTNDELERSDVLLRLNKDDFDDAVKLALDIADGREIIDDTVFEKILSPKHS